jgi:hypothetical protein
LAVPEIQRFEPSELKKAFPNVKRHMVKVKDKSLISFHDSKVPAFITESVSLGTFMTDNAPDSFDRTEKIQLKMVDFIGRQCNLRVWSPSRPATPPGMALSARGSRLIESPTVSEAGFWRDSMGRPGRAVCSRLRPGSIVLLASRSCCLPWQIWSFRNTPDHGVEHLVLGRRGKPALPMPLLTVYRYYRG